MVYASTFNIILVLMIVILFGLCNFLPPADYIYDVIEL
jgi:hypothetical protein